ncbi:hypothetical protein K3495_g756 [Podosphaera aphanis]|nr:hypothetical protein K3495_g756 [Podosphaera aphanis]
MDALTRQEYPAMLERLQPDAAVAKLNERVKKIGKINLEVADWLQERRKIEDVYSTSLLKLARRPHQDICGETGGFDSAWRQITAAAENIARSHSTFSERIKLDIEQPLRNFVTTNSEMSNMVNMQGNISSIAKELTEAQEKYDRLNRKGNKANSSKYDSAVSRLQAANQQWDAQAPFIFETLQALDEARLKNLQDMLAMYQTHEADHNEQNSSIVETTLKSLLDFNAEVEIRNWSQTNLDAKSAVKRNPRSGLGFAALPSPTSPSRLGDNQGDNQSGHSQPPKSEIGEKNKLHRIGTMFSRRRQSVHSVLRSTSPISKTGYQPFNRATSSRAGMPIPSPRASSSHLREPDSRLGTLPEMPHPPSTTERNENTLDTTASTEFPPRKISISPQTQPISSEHAATADTNPPPGLTPQPAKGIQVDDEGFSIPPLAEDPISQAQSDQPQFKLDIRKDPIPEQDSDAQAAFNVANTLRTAQISAPMRKLGTVRGRRDARHTMSAQSEEHLTATPEYMVSASPMPNSPVNTSRRTIALTNSSSHEHNLLAGSDNMSIQSGQSLTNQAPIKHPELQSAGLNCSIFETISALFEEEQLKSITIHGEVALTFNPDTTNNLPTTPRDQKIRIEECPNFEILGLNKSFIESTPGESSNEFTVQLPPITSKPVVALNYRVQPPPESSVALAPIFIRSAWKRQNEKLGMILEYSLNPAYSSVPALFSNLILIAHYTGEPASSCQTKPNGTHLKEKLMVYWRLGDILLGENSGKAVARFSSANGAVLEPGKIEAKWELHNSDNLSSNARSSINIQNYKSAAVKDIESDKGADPFADESYAAQPVIPAPVESTWVDLHTVRTLFSGKYVAN